MSSGKPTDLAKFKNQKLRRQAKGKTLCGRGFHKWQDEPKKQFDVKQGRLVSIEVCSRCGKERTRVS